MSSIPPVICSTLLVAMMAAGVAHFFSVQEFVARYPSVPATRLTTDEIVPAAPRPKAPEPAIAETPAPVENPASKEFFEELLSEVRALRNENKNLIDQVAETNRDMMKMEFRLDTHSESFRPLPVSENRDDRSSVEGVYDELPGVLPPRATPVSPLED